MPTFYNISPESVPEIVQRQENILQKENSKKHILKLTQDFVSFNQTQNVESNSWILNTSYVTTFITGTSTHKITIENIYYNYR